jgi:hypothetical protein
LQCFLPVLEWFFLVSYLLMCLENTWFSLFPFSSFYFLTYKSLVEAKLCLGWSFLPSCWISRMSWWGTYKIITSCCC